MVVTASYHLGYSEFRGDTLRYPEIGAVAANVPTVLTGNPVGSVVTHVTMHTSAVVHQRDGGQQHMLPPRTTGDYPDHGSSDLAAGLAVAWLVATAAALTAVVRRSRAQAVNEPSSTIRTKASAAAKRSIVGRLLRGMRSSYAIFAVCYASASA